MDERYYGYYLKLTKYRFLIKSGDNQFTLWGFNDDKKIVLTFDDIDILSNRIIEYIRYSSDNCGDADAVLENYIVKYCAEKCYYIFVHRKNLAFAMGLKRETIERIVDFHKTLQ